MGVSRKRIYYPKKIEIRDKLVRDEIDKTHLFHPAYGHRRLALALGYGKNRILRIMHKFGIKPPRRRAKNHWITVSATGHSYTNLIREVIPFKPSQIFVSDLTCLKYQGKQFYLATIEDIFTREVLSAEVSNRHDSVLALATIKKAIKKTKPEIFHSDQGTEFMAQAVTTFLKQRRVKISVSDKASPWQNGYKESFFGRFKEENGDLNRFETLGELVEEIYAYIYYYNNFRIHTSLKMTPTQFKQKYLESVSQKTGT